MARTTDTRVRDRLGESKEEISFVPFIRTANLIVTRLLSQDTEGLVDAATAAEIETCMAAHSYAMAMDPTYLSKSTGRASGSFLTEKLPPHLADAVKLDPTGYIASLGKERATMHWLGTTDQSPE